LGRAWVLSLRSLCPSCSDVTLSRKGEADFIQAQSQNATASLAYFLILIFPTGLQFTI
jgi:hypothetical protein